MSGGMEEARALGQLGAKLEVATHELCDAIRAAEGGYRGVAIDVSETVNEILLPRGWKLVPAVKVEVYR